MPVGLNLPLLVTRLTYLISGLKNNIYKERLRELDLQTSSERRHQADMAMVHKILHGRSGLDYTRYLVWESGERTESNKWHSRSLQLESEAWQAGPEEKILQYPSYRGLEPYTSWSEGNGQKWDLSSILPNPESEPNGPSGQMRDHTDPVHGLLVGRLPPPPMMLMPWLAGRRL